MSFKKLKLIILFSRIKASLTVYWADKASLRSGARHSWSRRSSIVIDLYFPNDAMKIVTVSDCVTQCLQNHRWDALASSVAIRIGVPHSSFCLSGATC